MKKRGMTKSLGVKGAKILVMIVKVTLDYSVNTSIRLRKIADDGRCCGIAANVFCYELMSHKNKPQKNTVK